MRVCVLFNPKAGSAGRIDALREKLSAQPGITILEAEDGDDLRRKAVAAARGGGFDLLAVAGGDGTVHAAVNALAPDFPQVPIAVLPLGTGNDLCRTLAVPLDPLAAADLLAAGRDRPLDVVRVDGPAGSVYSVNAVTGGFSGRVAADVTSELKQAWGPLAYLRGAVDSVADPPVYRLALRFDGGPPEAIEALNLVVANGRTAAGGVTVAAKANPEDGRFDVVIVRSGGGLVDLSIVAARMLEGDYLADENVRHRRASRLEVESTPVIPVSIDGELAEAARFTFEVVPRALRVRVGPDYHAEPHAPPADLPADADHPPPTQPRGVRQRLFGLLAAALHLATRLPKVYAAGLGVALLAVFAFAWLAAGVLEGQWRELNETVTRGVHARAKPGLTTLAVALTRLGDWWATTLAGGLVSALFLARRRYLDAATVIAILGGSWLLEVALKHAFRQARPALFDPLDAVTGYSFPSGHALRGTALYAGLAVLLVVSHPRSSWRWVVAMIAVCLAVGICWSRIYVGVHWLTDVVGGVLAAACWVSFCLLARYYAHTRPPRQAVQV